MDHVRIAELTPALPAPESKQLQAVVTLIWPYSSSTRQFALLLAEPQLRLRKHKGHVRVRFSGSSAKAIAATGVGIGDQVVLGLRGAQFVHESSASTPGKSIDWELSYHHAVALHVFRNGTEIANLNLVHVAPTPPPQQSPVRPPPAIDPSPAQQWSSPAFLKRARLSDSPFFDAPLNPFADEFDVDHDKKRRRKSYRDWKAWTYSARTPSPAQEDVAMEDELDAFAASPSRPTRLPKTPVSPPKPERQEPCDTPEDSDSPEDIDEEPLEQEKQNPGCNDDQSAEVHVPSTKGGLLAWEDGSVRHVDCDELNAGTDQRLLSDAQYAFGGDTELDTETEDDLQQELAHAGPSLTEADIEQLEDHHPQPTDDAGIQVPTIHYEQDHTERNTESPTEETSPMVMAENREISAAMPYTPASNHQLSKIEESGGSAAPTDALQIAMPPSLLALDANLSTFGVAGARTPIGTEPSSPTLKPLDSSTLPLPSPFPGGQDPNVTSYLDHTTSDEHIQRAHADGEKKELAPIEADYILETSFYSSIGSSKASASHPTHESAFTPLRFTFGMDGAGFSRPAETSSLETERTFLDVPTTPSVTSTKPAVHLKTEASAIKDKMFESTHNSSDPSSRKSGVNRDLGANGKADVNTDQDHAVKDRASPETEFPNYERTSGKAYADIDRVAREIATGSMESTAACSIEVDMEIVQDCQSPRNHNELVSTQQSAVTSEIVDLGSPSENGSDGEDVLVESQYNNTTQEELEDRHLQPVMATRRSLTPVQHQNTTIRQVESASMNDHSESAAMGHMHGDLVSVASYSKPIAYTIPSQALNNENDSRVDDWEPQIGMDYPNPLMQDLDSLPEASTAPRPESHLEGLFPDIKMESVEDDFLFQVSQQRTQPSRGDQGDQDPDDILIAVPCEGDKLGKMEYISVPATAPARNTRSKAKASASPSKEDMSVFKRSTRSSASKMSLTSNTRATVSPPRMRSRSTISQSQDVPQLSPSYSRSWSKLRSPPQDTSIFATAATRQSDRKPAPSKSTRGFLDLASSQTDSGTFTTSFEPSQELGGSQGRFSNVSFVKDSEEDSLHSEHSISTVQGSDDWTETVMHASTHLDDSIHDEDQHSEVFPQPKSKPRMLTKSSPIESSYVQSRIGSLRRDLRSTPLADTASSIRTHDLEDKIKVERVSSDLSAHAGEHLDWETPDFGVQDVAHIEMSGRDEYKHGHTQGSSTPPIDNDGFVLNPSSMAAVDLPSIKRQSVVESNSLVTPEATQQTSISSQPSRPQQQPTLTPQLTQATSTNPPSFQVVMDKSPIIETSMAEKAPHHDEVDAEITSSPSLHSADNSNSDDEATLVAHSEQPSIGLSTRLAYYTPLKDLVYFLNRSSQFHSSANPDILVLATSATSVATKAAKGPQHWTNTLHVTDLSSWPAITTVQIFRAHQTALPVVDKGDVVLLRAFGVKSLNRRTTLISADESSWCVWRYGKPVWGAKRGAFGELRAREEVRGPAVERGEGEWKEVERLRGWYVNKVKKELDDKEHEN